MTSGCDFLEAERYGNRKTKTSHWKMCRKFRVSSGNTSSDDMPTQFPESLFKRTSLEATHHEKISSLNEIVPCLVSSASLRSNVQRWAMGDVPAIFFLHDSEKLEGRLYYDLHKIRNGEGIGACRNFTHFQDALSTALDAREKTRDFPVS